MHRSFPFVLRRNNSSSKSQPSPLPPLHHRTFRSRAALDSLHSHIQSATAAGGAQPHHLALYNYPSFSGAFSALFAHLFHSRLHLPFLALPFSSIDPFRIQDFHSQCIDTCYLLDHIGPGHFAVELAQRVQRVVAFDHRKSTASRISQLGHCPNNLELHIDTMKSSACAVYDHFSESLPQNESLLMAENERDRVADVVKYIENMDLLRLDLPDVKAFSIGIKGMRAKLNSIINPNVFEQLLELNSTDLIAKGKAYNNTREDAAKKLLDKAFMIRLGRGLYGECLAIRADGSSNLSHEIGVELAKRSAAAGLRPIGAVVFMQRRNLKMCLRSTSSTTDTSLIAKAYGGGGTLKSSSFIIRMDEYNLWTSPTSL
ncbi:uncharacterized protein LOC120261258 [Dioscorea cayenensis subsp. rotundata]|uniref:Uncharacterized protein LOC120261258 n=1 Tax=Dioscorea cayennensis subsp. rotundata TaxID=55577 RepID=A0AB40BCF8_DIOCR|nr:uncharacterized protein LOC120261258 [Dioscorea cayenensis subsp. rotundata]